MLEFDIIVDILHKRRQDVVYTRRKGFLSSSAGMKMEKIESVASESIELEVIDKTSPLQCGSVCGTLRFNY